MVDCSKPIAFLLIVCENISPHKKCKPSSKIYLGGVTFRHMTIILLNQELLKILF